MSDPGPDERAAHYRRMAQAARIQAAAARDPEIRDGYLDLADRWLKLAHRAAGEPRSFQARAPLP